MSPRIGMAVLVAGWEDDPRAPAKRLLKALERCEGQGIPLRYGDHGVVPAPFAGGWARSPRSRYGVNVVGAVLLGYQPELPEGQDPNHLDPLLQAAEVLSVPLAYMHGAADGWDRNAQDRAWLSNIHRAHYLNGYEAGMEARFHATVLCDCGTRRFRSEATCPSCEDAS